MGSKAYKWRTAREVTQRFGDTGRKEKRGHDERILWMDFSFPSDSRTSLASAQTATWEMEERRAEERKGEEGPWASSDDVNIATHTCKIMRRAYPWSFTSGGPAHSTLSHHCSLSSPPLSLSIFTQFLCLHYFNHSIKSVNTFIIVASGGGCYLAITLFSNCIVTGDDGKRRAFSFDAGCLSGWAITPFAAVTLHSARRACLMPFI